MRKDDTEISSTWRASIPCYQRWRMIGPAFEFVYSKWLQVPSGGFIVNVGGPSVKGVEEQRLQPTMDQLIKVVNKLQDAFSAVSVVNPIDLPQIVVIGRYLFVC